MSCARSNKRPLRTEDSKADSKILLAKPEKHHKKMKENDGIDTQKMRGMVEGRGERSDCSKRNCIMKEKISELLAITGGKAQEKIEKTHTSDAKSDASGVNTPHTVPTVTAPIEEKKEEKHEEKLVNEMTKPKVTKVYVRRKNMVKTLDDTTNQVQVREIGNKVAS
ncbi:hypothetical protein DEO72_LG7g569 [Vigna unguiculata]|uniref:Uncharacterized protein n=1 Tax=Vigna unguiculata TaxID=3917 RepID=A0A4D6MG81_VIGUN|nr:hypothetical protein DEO72_LG7g569 [Vigna unguiculata]